MTEAGGPAIVTIGVPVYNGERFLAETLESLLGQTYKAIEIVVVDNASTDSTAEICRHFVKLDSRVRYHCNEVNVGAAGNVRRLGAMAGGRYFKLANADDLCSPDMVESCVEILESDPTVVLCCGLSRLVDVRGNHIRDYHDDMHVCGGDAVERFRSVASRIRLTNSLQGVARAALMRRLLPRHGSYDGADMVVLASVAIHGHIHQIPRVLFHRRLHEWSASSKVGNDGTMQEYLDPAASRSIPAYLTKIHAGYLKEIVAAPGTLDVKGRLAWSVARSLISQRSALASEWIGVWRSLLRLTRA